jgi:DNA-binding NarL/FixJ family response regulator
MEVPSIPPAPRSDGPGPIRVGVVDDHPSITLAVAAVVAADPELTLIGGARTVDDGLVLAARCDVLVCDIQLDGRAEGLLLLEAIHRRPDPPAVLVLSGFDHPSIIRAAIARGAAGYLPKSAEPDRIAAAIRSVAGGGTAFTAAQLRTASQAPRTPSARELEVIERVVGGATNAEIGAALGVTEKTVESHLRRMFDRYEVLSRTELAVLAIHEGWTTTSTRA